MGQELLPFEFDCSGVEKADPADRITPGAGVLDFYDALLKSWIILGKPASGLVIPSPAACSFSLAGDPKHTLVSGHKPLLVPCHPTQSKSPRCLQSHGTSC